MTDILARTSDGRVLAVGDSISLSGNVYSVTVNGGNSFWPENAFDYPISRVQNVGAPPSDLVAGYNYNYVAGAFTSSGVSPPVNTVNPWVDKEVIPTGEFIKIVTTVVSPAGWFRLQTDPASAYIFAMVLTYSTIDPNDAAGAFAAELAYLTSTNGADGQPLLTSAQVTAINAAWEDA